MSSFVLLFLLLGATSAQFYIPSKVFSAYQIIATNNLSPGSDMVSSAGSYSYTVNLNGVHNVDNHAITYSGHSLLSGATDVGFRLYVASNTSTQYTFNLYLIGTSTIQQLNFALLLVGSEGAGHITLEERTDTCNLVPPIGNSASSPNFIFTSGLAQPIEARVMLSGFETSNPTGYQCAIIISTPNVNGLDYDFNYQVGYCSLASITYVILVYSKTSPVVTASLSMPASTGSEFNLGILNIVNYAPDSQVYLNGFNKKCLFTMVSHNFEFVSEYLFDMNYPLPALNWSSSNSYSHEFLYMCWLDLFNCSEIDPNCLNCTSEITCTVCSAPLIPYIRPNQTQCVPCRDAISGCTSCLNYTFCTGCDPPYLLSAGRCTIPHCLIQTDVTPYLITCTVCNPSYTLLNNSCILVCTQHIFGCSSCVMILNVVTCTACQADYKLTENRCECKVGKLVNGLCVDLSGCVTPYVMGNGSVVCLFCNTTLGFLAIPSNGQCKCRQKYRVYDGVCLEICGDGYSLGRYQCDDGNKIDGDGCSSLCTVQVGYRCQNGSSVAYSVCFYVGIPLNLTLTSIRRNAELNQVLLSFYVYPAIFNLNKMNFLSHVELDCPANYTLTEAKYDYTGVLSLTVDYFSDLEYLPCSMTISFDSSIIRAPNVTVLFDAVSQTLPLVVIQHQEKLATINTIFTALSYICLGVFLASLGHKMIGAELTTSLQIIYLSNALYHRVFFFFNEVRRLQSVTGYWALFYTEIDGDFSPPFSQRVDTTPFFLESNLPVTILFITATTLLLVLKVVHHKKTANTEQLQEQNNIKDEQPVELQKLYCAMVVLYRMVIFPVAAGFMLVLMISSQIYSFRLDELRQPTFPHIINVVAVALVYLILSNVSSAELVNKSKKFTGFRGAKFWYIPLFVFRSLAMAILFSLGITHNYDTLAFNILAVQTLYLAFLILKRPYRRALDNVSIIILQFTTLYALALPITMRYISVSELDQILLVFILQGLICISMGLSIARTLVYYINATKCCSRCLSIQDGAVMIEAEPVLAIELDKKRMIEVGEEEEKKQIKEMNPYSIYNHIGQLGINWAVARANQGVRRRVKVEWTELRAVKQEEEKEEDPQLTAAKVRLRENLLKKKERETIRS